MQIISTSIAAGSPTTKKVLREAGMPLLAGSNNENAITVQQLPLSL